MPISGTTSSFELLCLEKYPQFEPLGVGPAISWMMLCNAGLAKGRMSSSRYTRWKLLSRLARATTDPLVHSGRHFGRVVYAFCNIKTLIINGLERLADDAIDMAALSARYVLSIFCTVLQSY
jgi:hypothetical protein